MSFYRISLYLMKKFQHILLCFYLILAIGSSYETGMLVESDHSIVFIESADQESVSQEMISEQDDPSPNDVIVNYSGDNPFSIQQITETVWTYNSGLIDPPFCFFWHPPKIV